MVLETTGVGEVCAMQSAFSLLWFHLLKLETFDSSFTLIYQKVVTTPILKLFIFQKLLLAYFSPQLVLIQCFIKCVYKNYCRAPNSM